MRYLDYLKNCIYGKEFLVLGTFMLIPVLFYFLSPFISANAQNLLFFFHYLLSVCAFGYYLYYQKNKPLAFLQSRGLDGYGADVLNLLKDSLTTDCIAVDKDGQCTVLFGNNLLKLFEVPEPTKRSIAELFLPTPIELAIEDVLRNGEEDGVVEDVKIDHTIFQVFGLKSNVNVKNEGLYRTVIIREVSTRRELEKIAEGTKDNAKDAYLRNCALNGMEVSFESVLIDFSEAIMIQNINVFGCASEIIFNNKAFIEVLDFQKESLSLSDLKNILHPIQTAELDNFFTHNFEHRATGNFTMRLHHSADSYMKIINIRSSVIRIQNTNQIASIVADVSKVHYEKEKLLKHSSVLQNLTQRYGDHIMVINKNDEIEFWSQNLHYEMGLHVDEIIGQRYHALANKISEFDWHPHIIKALSGQVNFSRDFQIGADNAKWFSISFAPFYVCGEIVGVMLILRDVTEFQKREQDLVNQKIINEEVESVKKTILANISHEIRTPLNNINGFLKLFNTENLLPKQQKYLMLIKKSSDQLLETVNNIVTISLLEANQLTFHYSWFSIAELLHEIKQWETHLQFKKDNVKLVVNEPDLTLINSIFFSARDRIKQLLEILIKNALKFTPKGSVTVDTQVVNQGMVKFTIRDTGIGMESTYTDLVFQPFLTAQGGTSLVYNGIGLGLSIAKSIVDKLKGSIEVETEVGVGTTFFIYLPISQGEREQMDENYLEKDISLKYKSALLIEDTFESSEPLKVFFSRHNLKITPAANGANAIEIFFSQHDFDIVFCDLRLSDIDGFEVLKALRRINSRIPVIAQSAFTFGDLQKKCLEAGFNDFIAKPMDLKKITKVLTRSY